MKRKKLLIAGGDVRMLYAMQRLREQYDTEVTGFTAEKIKASGAGVLSTCGEIVESADVLILPPVPLDADGRIPAPLGAGTLEPESVISQLKAGGLVLGGNHKGRLNGLCEKYGVCYKDYMSDPVLALGNAVPTAEAAIWLAMQKTGRTIWKSRVLVTGFGRIGAILTDRLLSLGAEVTAAARKEYDLMRIETIGARGIKIPFGADDLSETDIIFNTVPAEIFTEKHLAAIGGNGVLIDLASAPYGADERTAKACGTDYMRASGLPPHVMG